VKVRLVLHLLAVALLMTGSLAAIADQSGKSVGAHEIPPFVLERVELTPGVAAERKPKAEVARPAAQRSTG
jgi:hypothetical protein